METPHKLQIILLGTTGSGKSSSGNTILGKKIFRSHTSTQSVTVSYQTASATVNGMEVTVVDTPGWHCTKLSADEVASQIKTAILSVNGPYAFLMVIPIGSYTPKEIEMISKLHKILDNDFMKHTTILFTHSDNLESKSFERFLEEDTGLLQILVHQCKDRLYTWNNKDSSSVKNLDKMLQDLAKSQKNIETSMACSQSNIQNDEKKKKGVEQNPMYCNMIENTKRHKLELKENPEKEIRVAILGIPDVENTAIIRTLLGQKISNDCSNVNTVTTPGVNFELIHSPEEKQMAKVIFQSFLNQGPHVIMIVFKVGQLAQETMKMTECIHGCLDNSVAHTMMLFIGDDSRDTPIEGLIKKSPELARLVDMHGNRFHILNKKDSIDQNQVNTLLEKISKIFYENKGDIIKTPTYEEQIFKEDLL